jgi:hypothetical protein
LIGIPWFGLGWSEVLGAAGFSMGWCELGTTGFENQPDG